MRSPLKKRASTARISIAARTTAVARTSLPDLFAGLSTGEKARRAAHSPRMRAALARLRAELAALDADVALVTVVGDDGERDVLTPLDCNAPVRVSDSARAFTNSESAAPQGARHAPTADVSGADKDGGEDSDGCTCSTALNACGGGSKHANASVRIYQSAQ
eukprot:IDg15790t1